MKERDAKGVRMEERGGQAVEETMGRCREEGDFKGRQERADALKRAPIIFQSAEARITSELGSKRRQLERRTFRLLLRYHLYSSDECLHVLACPDCLPTWDW